MLVKGATGVIRDSWEWNILLSLIEFDILYSSYHKCFYIENSDLFYLFLYFQYTYNEIFAKLINS